MPTSNLPDPTELNRWLTDKLRGAVVKHAELGTNGEGEPLSITLLLHDTDGTPLGTLTLGVEESSYTGDDVLGWEWVAPEPLWCGPFHVEHVRPRRRAGVAE